MDSKSNYYTFSERNLPQETESSHKKRQKLFFLKNKSRYVFLCLGTTPTQGVKAFFGLKILILTEIDSVPHF
jgi:hypothetical protein